MPDDDTPDGFSDQPPVKCSRLLSSLALVAVLLVAVPGCCSCPIAEAALRTGAAANAGHAQDAELPGQARAIAQDNGDLCWQVLYAIGGCELEDIPTEVAARIKARKAPTGE